MNRVKNQDIKKWAVITKSVLFGLLLLFIIMAFVSMSLAADPVAGPSTFPALVMYLRAAVSYLIGLLAVVMVIVGGVVYATSEGSPDRMKEGREYIIAAIAGVLLYAFSSYLLGQNLDIYEGIISKFFPPTT